MFRMTFRLHAVEALKAAPQRFLFLGAPGVGKGTYASRLAKDTGIAHISTGDLLRTEMEQGSEIGKAAKEFVTAGNLVPSEIVDEMVKQKLIDLDKAGKGFILDGYPRNIEQAHVMDKYMDLDLVVKFHQPFDVIEGKISGRRHCSECKEGYNTATIELGGITMEPLLPKVYCPHTNVGTCNACNSEMTLEQRQDDHIDVVRHRLQQYTVVTAPLEDKYEKKLHQFDVLGSTRIFYPKFLTFLKERL